MAAPVERRVARRRQPGLERRIRSDRRSPADRRRTGRRTVASLVAALASLDVSLQLIREAEQLAAPLRTRLLDELARAAQEIERTTGDWKRQTAHEPEPRE